MLTELAERRPARRRGPDRRGRDPRRGAGRRGAGPVHRRRPARRAHRRRRRLGAAAGGGARRGRGRRAAHAAAGRSPGRPTPPRAPRSSGPGAWPHGALPDDARPRHQRDARRRRGGRAGGAGRRRGRPARPAGPGRRAGRRCARSASWSAWRCTPPRSPSWPTSCSRSRRTRSAPAATSTGRAAAASSARRWTPAACCPTAGCSTRWPSRWTSTCSPRRPAAAAGELARLGTPRRSSPRRARSSAPAEPLRPGVFGQAVLATWRQLLDESSLAVDEPALAGTARPAHVRCNPATAQRLGLTAGAPATVRTERGAITLPVVIADLPDGVVWLPANSPGSPGARHARRRARRPRGGVGVNLTRARHVLAQGPAREGLTRTQQLLADDPIWLILIKVVGAVRARRGAHALHDQLGAQGRGPDAAASGAEPGGAERLAAEPRRRAQARVQGRHHAGGGRQEGLLHRPGHLHDPRLRRLLGDPVRRRGLDLRRAARCCSWSTCPSACSSCWPARSIGVYGIVLGGWASGSPYPLLAALRSAAQVISYEIALGLSVVARDPLRRVAVDRGHRERAGVRLVRLAAASRASRCSSSRWSARPTAPRSTSPRPSRSSSAASTPSTRR